MGMSEWKVPLSNELLARLSVEVTDVGSFPDLVRLIQGRVEDGVLTVDAAFVDRIAYDAYVFGRGPWQLLLREVLAEIDAALGEDYRREVRESARYSARERSSLARAPSTVPETEWQVALSRQLLSRLGQEVTTIGSFPDLVRDVQARVTDGLLSVDTSLVDRISYDAYMYGRGPWQTLLREVLHEIDAAGAPST